MASPSKKNNLAVPSSSGTAGVARANSADSMLEKDEGVTWSDKTECYHCHAALGKRHFNPKHHCRLCGNSVCSTCSPSTIQFDGDKEAKRACITCVAVFKKATHYAGRMALLAQQLQALHGLESGDQAPGGGVKGTDEEPPTGSAASVASTAVTAAPGTLDAALALCEAAFPPAQDQHRELTKRLADVEAKLASATKQRIAAESSAEFERVKREAAERKLGEAKEGSRGGQTGVSAEVLGPESGRDSDQAGARPNQDTRSANSDSRDGRCSNRCSLM
eukprot:TRINITY_DN62855_c0_g1_i1.p1 TRINITY_DN62855_c0_g1~~TRINITY_DN62855_c0_g1_i1.p1  ORF type:complete len:277 (+),score=50.67 TRINITY_DN62855_c0_g1_i1:62-892(+)